MDKSVVNNKENTVEIEKITQKTMLLKIGCFNTAQY